MLETSRKDHSKPRSLHLGCGPRSLGCLITCGLHVASRSVCRSFNDREPDCSRGTFHRIALLLWNVTWRYVNPPTSVALIKRL